ncbi:YitT family protein [Bacillaceae bacterium S4-13-58]
MMKKYRRQPMSPILQTIIEYIYVIVGAAFIATAFNLFLLPNNVASGGVAGISTITKAVFGWEPAFVQWALNIPLFLSGVLVLGKNFGMKSLVGTIVLPFFVYLTSNMEVVTTNPLLGAIFGGMGVGIGLGIVFRGKASTGGIDVAAQIIHKFSHISLGLCIAMIDGLIVITAAMVFNLEQGLYALIGLFATSKTIDFVQVGFNSSKNVMIISDQIEEIRKAILEDVDRGVTMLSGIGGYTNEAKNILMCVVHQNEFIKLTQIIKREDPSAFVIAMNASEVLGEGFKTS